VVQTVTLYGRKIQLQLVTVQYSELRNNNDHVAAGGDTVPGL
jgi:hypothetical protein